MSQPPHFPNTTQVVDELIGDKVNMVLAEVMRGFERQERYNDKLDTRLDKMVTRVEFEAEIGRVDSDNKSLGREIGAMRTEFKSGISEAHSAISEAINGLKEVERDKTTKNRWLVGIVFTVVTLANGIFWQIANRFI